MARRRRRRCPPVSIDLITAAQAFHWFDQNRTRAEFARILKPGGWIALIWNDRHVDSTPFLRDYEALLRTFATDYAEVRHKELDLARVREFIGSDAVTLTVLANRQVFDYDGLRGRLLSSSYAPEEGQPGHVPMLRRLEEIFQQHQTRRHGGVRVRHAGVLRSVPHVFRRITVELRGGTRLRRVLAVVDRVADDLFALGVPHHATGRPLCCPCCAWS